MSFLESINISENDLVPERKKKREKKSRNLVFLLSKKRKKVKPASEVAKWTTELIKRKIRTSGGIQDFFNKEKINLTQQNKALYEGLVKSHVVNGNMVLSDTLTNKPLYVYLYRDNLKTSSISNDDLFLYLLFHNQINKDDIINDGTGVKNFYDIGSIEYVQFCSLPFVCEGEIEKGYYQDFSEHFAAIGVNALEDSERKDLFAGKYDKVEFNYDGYEYISYGDSDATLIFRKNKSLDNALAMYEAMRIINSSGKITKDEKTYEINKKVKYMDMKLIPDSFCPAFLITPDEVTYSVLFKIKLDYNKLFSLMEIKSKENIFMYNNMFYWDTMSQCFDFLCVLGITGNITAKLKESLTNLYDRYFELKDILNIWKNNQLLFQKILIDFYHSFSSKVNFDKLIDLIDKLNSYIELRNTLMMDETYRDVKAFVETCKNFANMVYNQFDQKIISLADRMKVILQQLNAGNGENIVAQLREVCVQIYHVSYVKVFDKNNKELSFPSFPFLVSPGGFLGNLMMGVDKNDDHLAALVSDLNRQRQMEEERNENQVNNYNNLLNNIVVYQEKLIQNTLAKYNEMNPEKTLNDEGLKVVRGLIIDNIKQNPELSNAINNQITQEYSQTGDVKNGIVDLNLVQSWINKYLSDQEKDKLERDNKINQIDQDINNLEDEKSSLLNQSISSVSSRKSASTAIKSYKDIVSRRSTNRPTFNVNFLRDWYADIIILSGMYGAKRTDYPKLTQIDLGTLMSNYPVPEDVADILQKEYNLQDPTNYDTKSIYQPSNQEADPNSNYKDKNFVDQKLKLYGYKKMKSLAFKKK